MASVPLCRNPVAGALVTILGSACGGGDGVMDPADAATSTAASTGEGGTAGTMGEPAPVGPFADACSMAPVVGPGLYEGRLAGAGPNLPSGICGFGGPDRFVDVVVPYRADVVAFARASSFVPSLWWLRGSCTAPEIEGPCATGLPLWVLDVSPGEPLHLAIGAAAPVDGDGAFELEVALRRVAGEGEPCGSPYFVRCAPGTVCDETRVPAICTALRGDVCASAVAVDLADAADATHTVVWADGFSDAHTGTCTGARRRDAVFAVAVPAALAATAGLRVTAEGAGLSVRAGTCLADAEVACTGDGTVEIATGLGLFSSGPAYVLVEGPAAAEPEPWPETVVKFERIDP